MGRLDEVKATINQGLERKLDTPSFHFVLYEVAFLQSDTPTMTRELAVLAGSSPEMAASASGLHAESEAYVGHREKARGLYRSTVEAYESMGKKESAAAVMAAQAFMEGEMDDSSAARQDATAALAINASFAIKGNAAYAFARAGDAARAESLAAELNKERPADTFANVYTLPVIRAAVELDRNNADKAVEILQPVTAYDLANGRRLLSAYERGRAYLLLHRGNEAAAEFQKVLGTIPASW